MQTLQMWLPVLANVADYIVRIAIGGKQHMMPGYDERRRDILSLTVHVAFEINRIRAVTAVGCRNGNDFLPLAILG